LKVQLSVLAITGGLTAFGFLALAAVILVQPGPESTTRLGLFFGIASIVVTSLVAMLRSDQSQRQTNGDLDHRIKMAVLASLGERRRTDRTPTPDDPNPNDPLRG
jgi:hypothetical protein